MSLSNFTKNSYRLYARFVADGYCTLRIYVSKSSSWTDTLTLRFQDSLIAGVLISSVDDILCYEWNNLNIEDTKTISDSLAWYNTNTAQYVGTSLGLVGIEIYQDIDNYSQSHLNPEELVRSYKGTLNKITITYFALSNVTTTNDCENEL